MIDLAAARAYIGTLPLVAQTYGAAYLVWLSGGCVGLAPERKDERGYSLGIPFCEGVEQKLCESLGITWADPPRVESIPWPKDERFHQPKPYGPF